MENGESAKFFSTLYQLTWHAEQQRPDYPLGIQSWLEERLSMTARLKMFCHQLTVEVIQEGFHVREALLDYELKALAETDDKRFWIREVLLRGDGVPWLAGRTVVPESSLEGSEAQLLELGTEPLGHYLFSAPDLQRVYLQIANNQTLWARGSLFKLSDKPLLLTELFLPGSPAYQRGNKE